MYFGGLWGGQLQRYRDNKALEEPHLEPDEMPAIPSRVVKLSDDMLQFAEEPRPIVILDPETGEPLKAGDNSRRFFEASWMHKYNGKYYFPIQPATPIACAMQWATILTARSFIRDAS